MKMNLLLVPILGSVLLSGCVYSHRREVVREPSHTIVVTEAPPAPRTEVIGVAPDEAHVWVQGYWTYTGHRWVWVPGHWEARPRAHAAWVPGHWDKNPTGRGWVWTAGHWD